MNRILSRTGPIIVTCLAVIFGISCMSSDEPVKQKSKVWCDAAGNTWSGVKLYSRSSPEAGPMGTVLGGKGKKVLIKPFDNSGSASLDRPLRGFVVKCADPKIKAMEWRTF